MAVDVGDSLLRRAYAPPDDKRFCNPNGTATSRAFVPRPKDKGKLSVDISSLTTYAVSIKDPIKYVLFELAVTSIFAIGLSVEPEPLEDNPAHASILGLEEDDDIKPKLLASASKRIYL